MSEEGSDNATSTPPSKQESPTVEVEQKESSNYHAEKDRVDGESETQDGQQNGNGAAPKHTQEEEITSMEALNDEGSNITNTGEDGKGEGAQKRDNQPEIANIKVDRIEAPKANMPEQPSNPIEDHRSTLGLGPPAAIENHKSTSSAQLQPSLQADLTQNRHDPSKDNPASYQPPPPRPYLQLRAMALQISSNTALNSSPTLVLEGRTNLSTARRSYYPKIMRTLPELQLWILVLTLSYPASIFSPFQMPPTSLVSGGSIHDGDPLVRTYLIQTTNQLARLLMKPHVLQHPATVALIDSDFSYVPPFPQVGAESRMRTMEIMERAISLARSGQDPLRPKKGAGPSANANFDVDGVAAALGLPTQNHSNGAPGSSYSHIGTTNSASSSSKNPLSIFSRNNASPQRIAQHQPVLLPPGEEDPDEEELAVARNEVTRLEVQFERASRAAQVVLEKNAGE